MIGIISDTHDNVESTMKAIAFFKEKKVEFVIHLGDVVAPPTLMKFEGLKMYFVRGNNDGELVGLKKTAESIGAEFVEDILELTHKGKKIAATHYPDKAEELANTNQYDYVLYGHDHKQRNEKIGKTRIINPGAHYYGCDNSVVLLDVEKDEVTFITP